MKKYADLHVHPSTKSLLKFKSFNDNTTAHDTMKYDVFLWLDELSGDRLDSQSSFSQLEKGDFDLVIAPLHAVEVETTKYTQLECAFNFAINPDMNRAVLKLLQRRDRKYRIAANEELKFLQKSKNKVVFANSLADLDKELGKVKVIFAVEGSHCLFPSTDIVSKPTLGLQNDIIRYLTDLLEKVRVFYLTLCHFSPCGAVGTHAFAIAGVPAKKLKFFFPSQNPGGIQELGWRIIDTCLNHDPITLIDVKHMSLRSRLQYYAFASQRNVPVLASHVGVCGLSWKEWLENLLDPTNLERRKFRINEDQVLCISKRPKGIRKRNYITKFNPQTINLFDEDLVAIAKSGGLIGLTADQRILGWSNKQTIAEVLTMDDFQDLCRQTGQIVLTKDLEKCTSQFLEECLEDYETNMMGELEEEHTKSRVKNLTEGTIRKRNRDVAQKMARNKKAHTYYFANTLLYVVDVLGKNGIVDPWNYVALGSDFDGLIDAINSFKTADRSHLFERDLHKVLVEYLSAIGTAARYGVDTQNLDADISQKLRLLFYENQKRFVQRMIEFKVPGPRA